MTPEELLKPRYKVIADYPESPYKIGDIEYNDTWSDNLSLADYPAIFKRLEWWEERDVKDMPEYVKYRFMPDSKEYIFKTPDHFTDSIGSPNKRGFFVIGYGYCSYSKSFPATESEYNEYIKSKA